MVNTTGNCGMAKGGSGDILAGMVLSLVCLVLMSGQAAGGTDFWLGILCALWGEPQGAEDIVQRRGGHRSRKGHGKRRKDQ